MRSADTVIIGAGMSGLATAAALGKGKSLVLLERDTEMLEPTVVPLDDAAKWHRRLEGALTTGKVVLRID